MTVILFRKKFSSILFTTTLMLSSTVFAADSMTMSLDKAIELALKNNPRITQSAEDRESARWNLSAVRRQHGPSLTWSSTFNYIGGKYYKSAQNDYARYHFFDDDLQPYHSDSTNTLSLSFPLYTGGQIENQIEGAEYALNSADLTLEYVRQNVKYQAAEAYFRVLQYNSAIKVQQDAVNSLQNHLEHINIQYDVGTVAKADVLSTEVQLANYKRQLNSAWGDYESAVASLNNVIGLPVDTAVVTEEELDTEPYSLTEEECLAYALEHRPDGISSSYIVKQAQSQINVAKADYRPSVLARARGYANGEKPFQSNHNGSEYWQIGLEMEWNIFDNGITAAKVNQAKASKRKAESQLSQQFDQIKLDIHNAYVELLTAEKNIEIAARAVSEAEAAYAIAQVRYNEGVDTNLNVMDAQANLSQAKNNYFNALYSYNVSKAKLEQVMGVPVNMDAFRYVTAVEQEGKTSPKALEEAQVVLMYEDGETFTSN